MSYTVIVPSTQRESYANFTIKVTDTIGENLLELVVFVNDLPSKVPVKLPRSVPSVTSVTVMILPVFAKLLPEELAILRDVTDNGVQIIRLFSPTLSIIANNANPVYAKAGNSLNIEFTVNNTIASSSASILESGLNQTIIQTSRDLSYTVIVPSTQRESYANFTIKVTDTIGENLSITEDDLPFNVFIDTKRPRIELVGNVSYSISQGTINPFIPNVTVTDGDPNYSGDFTLNTNATVDTSLIGSVYNYTYTARAEYVMFCTPSNDVFKFVVAVTFSVYEGLLRSYTLAPRSV